MHQAGPPLILASGSAGRAALLRAAGLTMEIVVPAIDEQAIREAGQQEGMDTDAMALTLAGLKAGRVSARRPEALVIGADQILVCEGRSFEKPADMAEAASHLRALSGRDHCLVTASVCHLGGRQIWQHVARPVLTMRRLSEAFIAALLEAEGPALLGSVGAYRIEGPALQAFSRIEGEHGAIIGLPMLALLGFLRQHGVLME